jgi:hypothetical protein
MCVVAVNQGRGKIRFRKLLLVETSRRKDGLNVAGNEEITTVLARTALEITVDTCLSINDRL